MSQNVSKCLTMGQQVSKGVMFLHIQVRKLSLLGIAVAGVYCCMGLRSVPIEPRSCLLLHSQPSIVSFNWQGSLVIRLVAIVQMNGFPRKKRIALIGKTVHARSFFCFRAASWWYQVRHELQGFFCFYWDLKGSGSKPDGSTPQIANSDLYMSIPWMLQQHARKGKTTCHQHLECCSVGCTLSSESLWWWLPHYAKVKFHRFLLGQSPHVWLFHPMFWNQHMVELPALWEWNPSGSCSKTHLRSV